MRTLTLPTGQQIGDGCKPFVVAEINTSHFGDIDKAISALAAAKRAGADVVKFQSWAPESLFTESYLAKNSIEARIYRKLSMSESDLRLISEKCGELGLGFASTPYSLKEVLELSKFPNVPFVKIASMDLPNRELLEAAIDTGLPVFLSTGMCTDAEIDKAVEFISARTKKLLIFHCTSVYPTPRQNANLRNISNFRDRFREFPIGFSDHTLGSGAAVAAIALGASVFEKHFTLDQSKIGFDNAMATEPDELKLYVEEIQATSNSLGSLGRHLSEDELAQRDVMRRSIYAAVDISEGEIVTREQLQFKRPGGGLGVDRIAEVIGKSAVCNIQKDSPLFIDQLS